MCLILLTNIILASLFYWIIFHHQVCLLSTSAWELVLREARKNWDENCLLTETAPKSNRIGSPSLSATCTFCSLSDYENRSNNFCVSLRWRQNYHRIMHFDDVFPNYETDVDEGEENSRTWPHNLESVVCEQRRLELIFPSPQPSVRALRDLHKQIEL